MMSASAIAAVAFFMLAPCTGFNTASPFLGRVAVDQHQHQHQHRPRGDTALFGSWGKRKKEFVEDEFAREEGGRRAFDAYELQERSDFLNKIRQDEKKLKKRQDEDFLEIAKMAGITDQSGDGVDPMGDFAVDESDIDEIDVSVRWDD